MLSWLDMPPDYWIWIFCWPCLNIEITACKVVKMYLY